MEATFNAWGTIVLIILIPIAIIGAILNGLLEFIIGFLDFLKTYFELIEKQLSKQ